MQQTMISDKEGGGHTEEIQGVSCTYLVGSISLCNTIWQTHCWGRFMVPPYHIFHTTNHASDIRHHTNHKY